MKQTPYHAFCDCGGSFTYAEDGQSAWHTCKKRDITFGEYDMTTRYRKCVTPFGRVQWFRDWQHHREASATQEAPGQ